MDNSAAGLYIAAKIDMYRLVTLPTNTPRCPSVCRLATPLLIFLAALAWGCHSTRPVERAQGSPPAAWIEWQKARQESIAGTNGWTTLISRYWLPEGRTSAGTDPTNQLVLPAGRAAASVGDFSRNGKSVHFKATPGVEATVGGVPVRELEMKSDAAGDPTKLIIGPLSFVIIERGERLGVRVRDPESPTRLGFAGLRFFPYAAEWRIEGRFEAFPSVRTMRVPDASGGMQELSSPGALVFEHGGKEYRLDAVEEPGEDEFFIIFTDRTAGDSTSAAGRFLYVARPDAAGRVMIDFNRAFTPPCGFTPFATCPRPPDQNRLPFAIVAGERKPVEAQ